MEALFTQEWGIPYYWIEDGKLVQRLNGQTRTGSFAGTRFVPDPEEPENV